MGQLFFAEHWHSGWARATKLLCKQEGVNHEKSRGIVSRCIVIYVPFF
jgi:hypothetical protein